MSVDVKQWREIMVRMIGGDLSGDLNVRSLNEAKINRCRRAANLRSLRGRIIRILLLVDRFGLVKSLAASSLTSVIAHNYFSDKRFKVSRYRSRWRER